MNKVPWNRVIVDEFVSLALLNEAVYNHLHKKHVEKAAEIVNKQNLYKR